MPASRNKRYNTLDLASKIVCQRQATPPSFGNLQGTGNRFFLREIETLFAGIHFPPRATIIQNWLLRQRAKMKKRIDAAHKNVQTPIRFYVKRTILLLYQMKCSFLEIVTGLIEDAEGKKE